MFKENGKQSRFAKAHTPEEWDKVRYFRDTYFFGPNNIQDPYTWTFSHPLHHHFILYQSTEIIGYAHIQIWPDNRAAMWIIVIEENHRNQTTGSFFLDLIEKWLKDLSIKSVHAESRKSSLNFYLKNGYSEMPFADPEAHESHPDDIPVGKIL